MRTLHYAPENVRNGRLDPAAAAVGFNLADVSSPETLRSLPNGVKGLYWLSEAKGVTPAFIREMNAIKNDPNLFAVYLADEPYPNEIKASDLKAESDWIHENMPGVKTFVVACNMGSERNPHFNNYYTVENTHIDLWGIDPYPIRSEMSRPNYAEIDRIIKAAQDQIGVDPKNIVPVYQAFGGVDDGDGGEWTMPTPQQARTIIERFEKYVPNPVFDFVYSWGEQDGNIPLSKSPALQQVFKQHFADGRSGDAGETYNGTMGGDRYGGTSGKDDIHGFAGNDMLGGRSGDDTIFSGIGHDRMAGEAGDDRMYGNLGADRLFGGRGEDSLRAGRGDDLVDGGTGKDKLFGDAGADTFVFDTGPSRNNHDLIVDFARDHDTIALDSDIFEELAGGRTLDAGAFKDIAAGARDNNDHILYNHDTGRLFYDADGLGGDGPILVATLLNHPMLTRGDFSIV